jgi:DNA-directed RNA polymerase specialized sigma24 family protein
MKPTYEVRAWREQDWWLARVVAASEGADVAPLDGVAHARTLTRIEQAARDMVATILDVPDESFDLDLEYILPPELDGLVCEAIGARTWMDAAVELWHERSAMAVHALRCHGFTRREAATLLGLPEPRLADPANG